MERLHGPQCWLLTFLVCAWDHQRSFRSSPFPEGTALNQATNQMTKISVPENSHSQRIKGAPERKEMVVWLRCHVLGRVQKRGSQAVGSWDWVSGCGCPKSSLQMSLEASLKEAFYSESSALLPVVSSPLPQTLAGHLRDKHRHNTDIPDQVVGTHCVCLGWDEEQARFHSASPRCSLSHFWGRQMDPYPQRGLST